MKNEEEEIRDILESFPEKFNIMERGIKLNVQKEYIELHEKLDFEEIKGSGMIGSLEKIIKKSENILEKKKALISLGHVGTIESYKSLEKIYKHTDDELRDWVLMAIQENIMSLENYVNEETIGMISTGLGGKGDKLRYYFAVVSKSCEPFTKSQQDIIKNEYESICKENRTEIEKINFNLDYAELIILMPMDVALDTIVAGGIKRSNEFGDFIAEDYYAANTEIPTTEELQKIIKEHLR